MVYGQTRRGVHPLPGVTVNQLATMLLTAAGCWAEWQRPWPVVLRASLALGTAALGLAGALLRWPPGPSGERVTRQALRWALYALRPRVRAGRLVPGWDGVQAICGGLVRTVGGWSLVLEWEGTDVGLAGAGRLEAMHAAWQEILHGLGHTAQVVVQARWLAAGDVPPRWSSPDRPGPALEIALAYRRLWEDVVRQQRALVHRCFIVVEAPPGSDAAQRLQASQEVLQTAMRRMGLRVRALPDAELAQMLREASGAAAPLGPQPSLGWWVTGAR